MPQMGKKRRAPVSDEQLIELYRREKSVNKVAKASGVSGTTIYRALERAGIERTGLAHYRQNATRWNRDTESEIRRRYETGEYYAQLVAAFGGTFYSIKQAIKRAGGRLTPVTPALSDHEKERVLQLNANGLSQSKIAMKLGRSQPAISRFLRTQGHSFKPLTHDRHPMWKGGRFITNGYVQCWVAADDPMAVMRNSQGYVAEHRLVMARNLRRPLKRHETVHHINGDPTDNRPENLQLRQGRHGKHVAMRCLDCGSHNVAAVPLEDKQ